MSRQPRLNKGYTETEFPDRALPLPLDRLASEQKDVPERSARAGRQTVVLDGSCRPLMDDVPRRHHFRRRHGRGRFVVPSSHDCFMAGLTKGAGISARDLTPLRQPTITRTPVLTAKAADPVDLSLRRQDAGFDRLESVLADVIEHRRSEPGA